MSTRVTRIPRVSRTTPTDDITQPNIRAGQKHGASVPSGPAFSNKPALIVAAFAGFGIWLVLILLFRWVVALLNRILGG